MNDQARLLQVDQMIDDIVADKASEHDNHIGDEAATGGSPHAWDKALVCELQALGPVDWPVDEVSDRISLGVAAEWRQTRSGSNVSSSDHDPSLPNRQASPWSRGSRRRLAAGLAAGIAASALLIAVIALAPGRAPSKVGQHSPTSPSGLSPGSSLQMRLVDSTTSPFLAVGGGPQTGNLLCVTTTVCYADDSDATASGVERTEDGGASWQEVAALPSGAVLSWPLSCPTAEACYGLASGDASGSLELAATTDEGAAWRLESLTSLPGITGAAIDQLSCATTEDCVVHVLGTAAVGGAPDGTFLSTTDGGSTWTTATAVPAEASLSIWSLQCDPDGACIGLAPLASAQDPDSGDLAALSSDDGGLTWTATSSAIGIGKGILLTSCGDALHCMAAYPPGSAGTLTIATTSNGGANWQVKAAPGTWPDTATSVSCPTGLDCYVSLANSNIIDDDPLLEVTHDGGSTWAPLSLPTVDGSPLAIVYPLSCPVAAGCIGVGATPAEFAPPSSVAAVSGSGPAGIPIKCDVVDRSKGFGTVSCSFSQAGSRAITCHVAVARPFTCQGVLENGDPVTISNHGGAAPTKGEWVIISGRSGKIDMFSQGGSPNGTPNAKRVIISNLPESDG